MCVLWVTWHRKLTLHCMYMVKVCIYTWAGWSHKSFLCVASRTYLALCSASRNLSRVLVWSPVCLGILIAVFMSRTLTLSGFLLCPAWAGCAWSCGCRHRHCSRHCPLPHILLHACMYVLIYCIAKSEGLIWRHSVWVGVSFSDTTWWGYWPYTTYIQSSVEVALSHTY